MSSEDYEFTPATPEDVAEAEEQAVEPTGDAPELSDVPDLSGFPESDDAGLDDLPSAAPAVPDLSLPTLDLDDLEGDESGLPEIEEESGSLDDLPGYVAELDELGEPEDMSLEELGVPDLRGDETDDWPEDSPDDEPTPADPFTDEPLFDEPKLLPGERDFLAVVQSATATAVTPTNASDCQWVYTCAQAQKIAAGYDAAAWTAYGDTFTAYNLNEIINSDAVDANSVLGNGTTVGDLEIASSGDDDLPLQPIPTGNVVTVRIVPIRAGTDTPPVMYEYWITGNGVPSGLSGSYP